MTKSELKTGMIVRYRCGALRVVMRTNTYHRVSEIATERLSDLIFHCRINCRQRAQNLLLIFKDSIRVSREMAIQLIHNVLAEPTELLF